MFNCMRGCIKKDTQQRSIMRSPAPMQNKASLVINKVAPEKYTI